MKRILLLALLLLTALAACSPTTAKPADIRASAAWVRAMPASTAGTPGTTGAFLELENRGGQSDRLISAATEAAATVEIHQTTMQDGVMKMSPLAEGLEIPAGETVVLEPGGIHIMLIGLTRDLIVGETLSIELNFEDSGRVMVPFEIRAP